MKSNNAGTASPSATSSWPPRKFDSTMNTPLSNTSLASLLSGTATEASAIIPTSSLLMASSLPSTAIPSSSRTVPSIKVSVPSSLSGHSLSTNYAVVSQPVSTMPSQPPPVTTSISDIHTTTVALPSVDIFQQHPNFSNPNHQHTLYHVLVYMAEQFRVRKPPQIRMAIHCLKSILLLNTLPPAYLARTYLQVARLVWQNTPSPTTHEEKTKIISNDELISNYLMNAIKLGMSLRPPEECIKLEAIDLLAEFHEKRGRRDDACDILNQGLNLSSNNQYWQCRFLFRLAQARLLDRDFDQASECLSMGAQFAQIHRAEYTRGLFLLSKCMLHLSNRQHLEFQSSMNEVKDLITLSSAQQSSTHATPSGGGASVSNVPGTLSSYQKESLLTFYLVLDVSKSLMEGKAKSARDQLKQLQQHLSVLANMDEAGVTASPREMEHFQWLTRDQLSVLVYLLSVVQNVQSGIMDRAERYVEKALHLIEKVSYLEPAAPVFSLLQLSLIEQLISCRLIMGHKALVAQDVARLIHLTSVYYTTQCNGVLHATIPPAILPPPGASPAAVTHIINLKRRLHCVLGLFAMSMNHMEEAGKQFTLTKKITQPSTETIHIFANLNLALVFLRQHRLEDSGFILRELEQQIPNCCFGLQIAYQYVRGFYCMFLPESANTQYQSARFHLRECLRMSLDEDLTRISANTLSTLGQVAVNLRDFEEAKKMIEPASQLADRIPDVSVQLWTSALLKDVYAVYFRDKEKESHWYTEHDRHSKLVINDHLEATNKPEKQWIEWLGEGLPPVT